MDAKDTNGAVLTEGDSVKLTRDLKVKGSSTILKRGTVVKNIRLTQDMEEVEGRIGENDDGAEDDVSAKSLRLSCSPVETREESKKRSIKYRVIP